MSLKQEIETWVTALAAYDHNEFDNALRCFETIADTSKILFNCGVIQATLGHHQQAIECYQRAVRLDQYLAIAYFQQGVSNFLMGDFEEALANFNDTLLYLRGNNNIDYEQLGLKFKLYSCEVLFNRGLCYIYLQQLDPGMQDLIYATREKMVQDHDVIDEAIKDRAEGYTVFSIPVGVVFRPNEAKVKNLKAKDYLGKARLVAEERDFLHHGAGNAEARRAALAALALDDRPADKLSYAAMNLVRQDLRSRARQQSEPPLHRNVFPPTPPLEPERVDSPQAGHAGHERHDSVGSERSRVSLQQARPAAKPLRLELGAAAFEQRSQQQQQQQQQQQAQAHAQAQFQQHQHHQQQAQPQQPTYHAQSPPERPRIGNKRSESERPSFRREFSGSSYRSSDSRRADPRLAEFRIEEDPVEAMSEQLSPPAHPSSSASSQHSSYHAQYQQLQQQQQQLQRQALTGARSRSSAPRGQPVPIEEEDEDDDDEINSDDLSDDAAHDPAPLAFEIVAPPRASHASSASLSTTVPSPGQARSYSRHRSQSRRPVAQPAPPPPPEVRTIRLKVHGGDDMRYVLTTPATPFAALVEQIRAKFALPAPPAGPGGPAAFKLKIRDEDGDLVTLGDQDDWEMTLGMCKAAAWKARAEMGKLEMWVQEV